MSTTRRLSAGILPRSACTLAVLAAATGSLALPVTAAAKKPPPPPPTGWTYGFTYAGCVDENHAAVQSGECSTTGAASTSTGRLTITAAWAAGELDPQHARSAYSGAVVGRYAYLRNPGRSLTFTGVFGIGENPPTASETGGNAQIQVVTQVFRPGCTGTCAGVYAPATVVRAFGPSPNSAPAGDVTTTVTLTDPNGGNLPSGNYRLEQVLYGSASGPRLLGNSADAHGSVTAKGITISGR